ncbi:MAG TPA: four helix bundle protein [Chloroflexia bacterium]|nr:four helix bundle protein [Chloroflexia bacterium]
MQAKIGRFEDLVAWQKARVLTRDIYAVTQQGRFAKDFSLSGQIQRAAVSIMSNLAEGFERGSRAEFHHFLSIAKSSCAELRSQLYVALDIGYIGEDTFRQIMLQAEEVGRIIGGLRSSVEKQRDSQKV